MFLVNTHLSVKIILIFFLINIGLNVQAQDKTIALIKDNNTPFINQIENELKKEINNLLIGRQAITFVSYFS